MFPSSLPTTTASFTATTDTTTATTSSETATTTSRAALLADFWQATQFSPSPPTSMATTVDAPETSLATAPATGLPCSEMRLAFSGLFQSDALSPENASAFDFSAYGFGEPSEATSLHAPESQAGKRTFDFAFGAETSGDDEYRARLAALPKIPALEPTPSTSGLMRGASVSISNQTLRKTLLTLADAGTQAEDWFATLEWRAVDTALEKGAYPDAHRLLQGLVRRLETEQTIADWPVAFERVVSLATRFESRTANAAKTLLLTHDGAAGAQAQRLARTSTQASIDRLITHRLHAIGDMPALNRAEAWDKLLASLQRTTAGHSTARLTMLATFIRLLPEAEQNSSARAIITAAAPLKEHDGWGELTKALLGAVRAEDVAAVARAIVQPHPDHGLCGIPMKNAVEAISHRLRDVPTHESRPLFDHLVEIITSKGDFDDLIFSDDERIEMLQSLRSTCAYAGFKDCAREVRYALVEALKNYEENALA